MNRKKLFSLFCLSVLCGCSSYKTVYCPPNKEPVQVLKDPGQAYPIYARGFEMNLKATASALKTVPIGGDLAFKTQITELREKLNNESSRVQEQLKTAVIGLQTTPCDPLARSKFWSALMDINTGASRLTELSTQLKANSVPPKQVEGPTTAEIEKKRENAKAAIKEFESTWDLKGPMRGPPGNRYREMKPLP